MKKVLSLLSWPLFRSADPVSEQKLLPGPAQGELSAVFSKAVFGRKFRTCEYSNVHLSDGNTQYLKAVATAADQWNVIKVSHVEGDYTALPVLDNVSFGQAAQYLLGYELTALDMNLLPCGRGKDDLGFEHVENFCLREGFVPDRNGHLHQPIEGEIVTQGSFDPGNVKKYEDLYTQIQDRNLILRNVWNAQSMIDLFAHYKEGPQWSVLRQDIAELHRLKDVYFCIRCAVLIEQCVLDIQNGSEKYNRDPINKIMGLLTYDGYWMNDETLREMAIAAAKQRDFDIADHVIERVTKILEGTSIQSPDVKGEAVRFLRDLRIFELTRKCKDLLSKGALSIGNYHKQSIDEWMCAVVTLANKNAYSEQQIENMTSAMCDTTPLTALPDGVMEFMAAAEQAYLAEAARIDQQIGNDVDMTRKDKKHPALLDKRFVDPKDAGSHGWEP